MISMNILAESDKKSIFFIIPERDEGAVIRTTLEPLVREGYSVVVVDDGSSDDSWEKIQSLPVYALRHRVSLGQGAALQTGMTFALSRGAKFLVHFDADGQHRFEDVPGLLEPVLEGKADVALGSRFLRREDEKAVPLSKRILLQMAIVVNGVMTGLWLTDAHNGLRVLSRLAAERIHLCENGYAHATEIIDQICQLKLRYVERPMQVHYSKYSRAKGQSLWNALNILIDLLLGRVFK
jgi:glycosyltransferase involved in cell wall biosynthesis